MLRSMTGFGQVIQETPDSIIRVEIKSVNSRNLDLTIRAPKAYAEKEITLRSTLSNILQRGKISIYIENEAMQGNSNSRSINKELLLQYYKELKEIAAEAGAPTDNLMPVILGFSDVVQSNSPGINVDGLNEDDWKVVEKVINDAVAKYDAYRLAEGKALEEEFRLYIANIQKILEQISAQKDERFQRIKQELRDKITAITESGSYDENRFEQELIYYAEKLDITEEIVRLTTHLNYFLETMEEDSPGKKLNFIGQEIGREINTIGSKANDANIQRAVVLMKEELEKIKEQLLNVL